MKHIGDKKYIGLDADGLYYPIDEEKRSIVLNGTEYTLPNEVWYFMLCLESEKEYYREKYMGLTASFKRKPMRVS